MGVVEDKAASAERLAFAVACPWKGATGVGLGVGRWFSQCEAGQRDSYRGKEFSGGAGWEGDVGERARRVARSIVRRLVTGGLLRLEAVDGFEERDHGDDGECKAHGRADDGAAAGVEGTVVG